MVLQDDLQEFGDETVVLEPAKSVVVYVATGKNPPADATSKTPPAEKKFQSCGNGGEEEQAATRTKGNGVLGLPREEEPLGTPALQGGTNDSILRETFANMGLRLEKNVAEHLLLENAYDSNLLSDIADVDYLEGNQGSTNLRPLEGLPAFVDDIYVFGYLPKEECVVEKGKGKLSCTTGENGAATLLVRSVANALERALGKRGYMPMAIVHTVSAQKTKKGNSAI